jgi:hypothetical protein
MDRKYAKMTTGDVIAAIKTCEQLIINLQKHTTALENGFGLPKDPASRAQLIESNAKNIEAKLKEMEGLNDELGRRT